MNRCITRADGEFTFAPTGNDRHISARDSAVANRLATLGCLWARLTGSNTTHCASGARARTEEDVAKEAALEKSRAAIMDKIEAAKQQAIKAGSRSETSRPGRRAI
jgi:hypothetical protein